MSRERCHRSLSGHVVDLWVNGECRGTRATDGKIKAPTCGRAHVVGWIEVFGTSARQPPAGALPQMLNDFNVPAPSLARIRGLDAMTTRDDDLRIRPGRIRARQPRRQAPEELRRRGDAGREEGRPCRQQTSVAPGPAGPLARSAAAGARRSRSRLRSHGRRVVDQGARRASSRHALPLGAAAQAHRLSQARRRDPRRRGRPHVRRPLGCGG